jgi:phosphate starvation-inducible protein PhoH
MFSLKRRIVEERPDLKGLAFAFAVLFTSATPQGDLRIVPDEWQAHEMIVADDYKRRLLSTLLTESLEDSIKRLEATTAFRRNGMPFPSQTQELTALLRPELEFYQPPRVRASETNEELRRYTEEQFDALDAAAFNDRVYYDGLAGVGKTLLAIEAAQREAATSDRRILFLCFNAMLREWLHE